MWFRFNRTKHVIIIYFALCNCGISSELVHVSHRFENFLSRFILFLNRWRSYMAKEHKTNNLCFFLQIWSFNSPFYLKATLLMHSHWLKQRIINTVLKLATRNLSTNLRELIGTATLHLTEFHTHYCNVNIQPTTCQYWTQHTGVPLHTRPAPCPRTRQQHTALL